MEYRLTVRKGDDLIIDRVVDADMVIELMRPSYVDPVAAPAEAVEPARTTPTGKKVRLCGACGRAGHRADTCDVGVKKKIQSEEVGGSAPAEPAPARRMPDQAEEDALVERIRELFVKRDMNSMDVCADLRIGLGRFNFLVQKYGIAKRRTEEDENFGRGS